MILEFELGAATFSNNMILRMHWGARRRAKIAIGWRVKVLTAGQDWPSPAPTRVAVDILRIGRKLLDTDNLYGGAKLLIDAIVDAGLVLDDSPKHIELTVRGEIGTPPRTRVRLEASPRRIDVDDAILCVRRDRIF